MELIPFLEHTAYQMRVSCIRMTTRAGSGHVTSALSAADLVAAFFFYAMRFDPRQHDHPGNDRFILSKGHASPVLYAVWKELGVLTDQDLLGYRSIHSTLEGHPTPRFAWSEAATGSLGQGLSIGVGMSLGMRLDGKDAHVYVLLGDAEMAEGSVWEALELASYYKLNHLVACIDVNRLGQAGQTMDGYDVERYAAKGRAFGWNVVVIDGHDMKQIVFALDQAKTSDKPCMIVAKTVKGFGTFDADQNGFHGKAFSETEATKALEELQRTCARAASYQGLKYKPETPKSEQPKKYSSFVMPACAYTKGDRIATRHAYGAAVRALGSVMPRVVCLDGDVKNSTGAELFEAQYPDRFVQAFVAEQNMVGMGVGFSHRGYVPFVSTFACFLTRAFDQLRMAGVGRVPLRVVGSHAGVSIGQDGPSQMGLEDIAMMRTIPNSVVLYPCDAVSTWKLVEQMARHDEGMSYLRTTRGATPVLYDNTEQFPFGGCKVVKQSKKDVACVVSAGYELFQVLEAYEQLQKEGISIAVIDAYSIKPLDSVTIGAVAQQAQGNLITVEDHYLEGGLGQAITYELRGQDLTIECMAVRKLPRSGSTNELLSFEELDAASIVQRVRAMITA